MTYNTNLYAPSVSAMPAPIGDRGCSVMVLAMSFMNAQDLAAS